MLLEKLLVKLPFSPYFPFHISIDEMREKIGHSHVVIEAIDSLTTTTVSDPTTFAFFKGLNDAAVNGVLSATVKGGLPAGTYKVPSSLFLPTTFVFVLEKRY